MNTVRRKTNYDSNVGYTVDPPLRTELFARQTECVVAWTTSDGWPVGVMHRFVWHDERFWVTTMGQRLRVPALRKRPKSCVVVSGENLDPTWKDLTVTAKTLATVHDGAAVAEWFYPALADRITGGRAHANEVVVERLSSPGRVVIELEVVKWISNDPAKTKAHLKGEWEPGQPWPGAEQAPEQSGSRMQTDEQSTEQGSSR